jgi:hypothetical protein
VRYGAALVSAGALTLLGACHEKPVPLTPDLKVEFHCAQVPPSAAILSFMTTHGFTGTDVEAARERKGKHFFPLQVDGVDSHRAIFEVIGLKEPPSYGSKVDYRLTILSAPPTTHDPKLESEAQDFLEGGLGCRIASIENGTNNDASTQQFDLVYDEVEHRLNRQDAKPPS